MARENLRLPCALKNGVVVPIERANRFEKGYICPGCLNDVIVRKGDKRRHHFAHHTGVNCETGYQTAIHLLAKEIITQEKRFRLPYLSEKYAKDDCFTVFVINGEVLLSFPLAQTLDLSEASVKTETKLCFDRIPDILIEHKGQKLAIEIYVTHKVSADKISDFQNQNISLIEIDLSRQKMPSKDNLKTLLCDSREHKTWLFNRKMKWLLNKIEVWESDNSKDKFVIHTPKRLFSIKDKIDVNIKFKPINPSHGKNDITNCPRKLHYAKNNFFALEEDCKSCPFFIGSYVHANSDALRGIPEKGILCQQQIEYEKHSLDDLKQWLFEYTIEESRRITGMPWRNQPDFNRWIQMIFRKTESFIPYLNEDINRNELCSIIIAIAKSSYRKYNNGL